MQPERHLYTFVALGSFNPAIFHPKWFETNELIPAGGWSEDELEVCSRQLSIFTMDELRVEVTGDRLAMLTQKPSLSPALKDLAVGALAILEHTPLTAVGLNLQMHFRMPSLEAYHDVGHRLAPKTDWDFLDFPAMLQLKMQGRRTSTKSERLEFAIGPADDIVYGLAVAVNQHYNLDSHDVRGKNLECRRILMEDWPEFMRFAADSAVKLLEPSVLKEHTQ
eukprot:TRINITY_DN483_c0_g1_i15.p1 TRINITY_DN483_c0_g1~~TRINITY_DN483_c0_g1_i15.p1  ORF type:complete len:222 (+),score=23.47 TRINITY_DN483_c0_g1_i15:1021-1686(+)